MRKVLLGLTALSGLAFAAPAIAQTPQQCVTNAVAGGTADAITVPLLPCGLATNILILTIAASNTTTTPTLQMAGFPAQRIYTNTLADPGIGDFGGAGSVLMLASTGSSWLVINGNVGGYIPLPLSVANGGTGDSTLTSNGVLYGAGTSAVGVTAAGTTGQYLAGSTGSAPSWQTLATGIVTTVNFGSTGFTPSSATSGAITVAGTLAVGSGGTGQTTYTNGQLLVGDTVTGGLDKATLTAGSNVTITNSAGGITIASSGLASGCGTSGTGRVLSSDGAGACTSNTDATFATGTLTLGTSTSEAGKVKLFGATSGSITLAPPVTAGSNTLTLPAGTTDFSATGGTSQVIKQVSAGGAFTVGQLACADLSNAGSGCSGSGITAIAVKTTAFNAAVNSAYCVDTVTTGVVTGTLPASPANNDVILFVACSNYSTNNFTVARNGNNIQGLAQDMTVSNDNAAFHLIFVTSYGWRLF